MSATSGSSQSFQDNCNSSVSLYNSTISRRQQRLDRGITSSGLDPFSLHHSLDELLVGAMYSTAMAAPVQTAATNGVDQGEMRGPCGVSLGLGRDREDLGVSVTERPLDMSRPKSRSIVTYLRESFPFKRPIWQTDLTNSSSEMSEYDSETSAENIVSGDHQHCAPDDSQQRPREIVVQARDVKHITGGNCECLGKLEGQDDETATATKKVHAKAIRSARLLARQSAASSSHSLDLMALTGANGSMDRSCVSVAGQQTAGSKTGAAKGADRSVTTATSMVGATAGDGALVDGENPSQHSRKPVEAGKVRRPKFGQWPESSTGFSLSLGASSTTTATGGRTTSSAYFSDDCTSSTITGSRTTTSKQGPDLRLCRPIGPASMSLGHGNGSANDMAADAIVEDWRTYRCHHRQQQGRLRQQQRRRHHCQYRQNPYRSRAPAALSLDNFKCLIKQNLVATLVAAYVLVSLAVIGFLVMPYVFNIDRSLAGRSQSLGVALPDKASQLNSADLVDTTAKPASPELSKFDDERWSSTMKVSLAQSATDSGPVDQQATKKLVVATAAARLNQARTAETQSRKGGGGGRGGANYQDLWRHVYKRRCEPLKAPLCSRSLQSMLPESATTNSQFVATLPGGYLMNYDRTLLPNRFINIHQQDFDFEKLSQIVDIRCYTLMPLFVCSIFAPKCVEVNATIATNTTTANTTTTTTTPTPMLPSSLPPTQSSDGGGGQSWWLLLSGLLPGSDEDKSARRASPYRSRLVPPCRSLCKEAMRKCSFFLEVLGIRLLGISSLEDCDKLPESSNERVCVGQKEYLLLKRAEENQKCRNEEFRCNNGDCIPAKWHCDGFADCSDKSDEDQCSQCNATSQFYCGSGACISKLRVCDGLIDCKDGRDERLCLRLSSYGSEQLARSKAHLRRLETWNASLASWLPVCGAKWQATPMSHEACQALGYTRANETLLLYETPLGTNNINFSNFNVALDGNSANATNRSDIRINYHTTPGRGSAGDRLTRSSANSANFDHSVTYEHQRSVTGKELKSSSSSSNSNNTKFPDVSDGLSAFAGDKTKDTDAEGGTGGQAVKTHPSASRWPPSRVTSATSATDAQSLAGLMSLGAQVGCLPSSPQQAQLMSTVYLSCQGFQCGRSITSHLSRVSPADQLGPIESSAAISTATKQADQPSGAGASLGHIARSLPASRLRMPATTSTYDDDDDGNDDYKDDSDVAKRYGRYGGRQVVPVSSRLVVGGIESMPGEFPYLAALYGGPDEVFFCGGVLISANWLLTASHCVGNRTQADGWMVKVGVTRRIASPAFVKKLKVQKIIKHHEFDVGVYLNNDIALILLAESVEFNHYLRPICLPQSNLSLGPDNSKDCVVVGFGKPKFSQDANYLQAAHFVNVPIVHHSVCSGWYAEQDVTLSEGMLCAGYSDGKRDACQGDSGSGLFCRLSNTSQFFIAGIVSFGINCATAKLPGIYTSVPAYVNWIKEVTRNNSLPVE